ncbi:MAG: hypothetical protein PHT12_00115 [Patescibacteria group bacterium]|nr:hypothetical protein [Patescibacteria group bacterium]
MATVEDIHIVELVDGMTEDRLERAGLMRMAGQPVWVECSDGNGGEWLWYRNPGQMIYVFWQELGFTVAEEGATKSVSGVTVSGSGKSTTYLTTYRCRNGRILVESAGQI